MAKDKMTQKDKVDRGMDGEALMTASLTAHGLWHHKMVDAGYGTPFDKIVVPPGGGYAFEVKTMSKPNIPYSKIRDNQRKGLTRFSQRVGGGYSYIIGIWLTEGIKRAFVIPWVMVADEVCSGVRGSINMLDFAELDRCGDGWDMSRFMKGRD